MRKITLLACVLLFACETEQKKGTTTDNQKADLATELLGTWEVMDISVHVPTYLGEDTTVVESIREADWGKLYGVKPARTRYTPDGKLMRTHKNIKDELIDVTHGLWRIQGDSLMVIEPNITFAYLPHLMNDKLELKGRIDWDRDGETDDDFQASYRLVSRTE
ncbi:MAG: hypothetical protein AAF828_07405 [Bacteroidota bacterium]